MSDTITTPAEDATDSAVQTAVGALLRENRERAGLDIADVARVLRISQKYLEALEDGRNADLPGTPYAIGFVRSYAEHLHLDGEEIVRRYKDEAEGLASRTDLVFPKPIPDGGVPGAAVLGLGVIVAAVAYGVWYWNSNKDDVEVARVEAVPEHIAATPEPTAPAVAPAQPVEATPVEEVVAEEAPVPVQEAAAATQEVSEAPAETMEAMAEEAVSEVAESEPVAEAVENAAMDMANHAEQQAPAEEAVQDTAETAVEAAEPSVEAVPEPAPAVVEETSSSEPVEAAATEAVEAVDQAATETAEQVVETANEATEVAAVMPAQPADAGPSRITVRAKSNSWIQVRDEVADRLLFTRLLREGDEYDVPNRGGLRLMTGNAGALELLVDGEAVPAIGDVGEVRRNVELDADKLKSGAAVTE